MIVINDKFSIEKDAHSWELIYTYAGKGKDGNDKKQRKSTWHANLKQVAKAIVNYSAGECESMDALTAMLERAENSVEGYLNNVTVN